MDTLYETAIEIVAPIMLIRRRAWRISCQRVAGSGWIAEEYSRRAVNAWFTGD
jgi:hypothetical protein